MNLEEIKETIGIMYKPSEEFVYNALDHLIDVKRYDKDKEVLDMVRVTIPREKYNDYLLEINRGMRKG